jgi:riboflavin synthase
MFTGLIEAVGEIISVAPASGGVRLGIELGALASDLTPGDSLAVSGPCLTLTSLSGSSGFFDVVSETCSRTTIQSWRPSRKVNLERSLKVGGRLDGHYVLGHIDGPARLLKRTQKGSAFEFDFSIPEGIETLVAEKGSVALDGTSLTVARLLSGNAFRVALIPQTLSATTLGDLRPGDQINFEADVLARYAARMLKPGNPGSLTEEMLHQSGFM